MCKRILFVLASAFLLSGCIDYFGPYVPDTYGLRVSNYPEWLDSAQYYSCAATDWFSWSSPELKPLRDASMLDMYDKQYAGQARLIDRGQFPWIQFDDGRTACLFYLWLAEDSQEQGGWYSVPAPDPGTFSFAGKAAWGYGDSNYVQPEEIPVKFTYVLTGEAQDRYEYTWTIEIDGRTAFDGAVVSFKESSFAQNAPLPWMTQNYYDNGSFAIGFESCGNSFIGLSLGDTWSWLSGPKLTGFSHGGLMQESPALRGDESVLYRLRELHPYSPYAFLRLEHGEEKAVSFVWLNESLEELSRQELEAIPEYLPD